MGSRLRKWPILLLWLISSAAAPLPARGASPGDEVILIYNKETPGSREVAEHYAKKRHVPAGQILGLSLPTTEDISRVEFRDQLQKPLAKWLANNNLWRIGSNFVDATTNHPARVVWKVNRSKIRYAVLCYGVPLRIPDDPNVKEAGLDKIIPQMRSNGAAVDSELALLPMIEDNVPLHGPLANWAFSATNEAALHPTNGLLLVTRLDAPSVKIANALVDKAMEAETNGMWGRAYFDLRDTTEPGFKMGDDWLRAAADICKHSGFETVIDNKPGTFPSTFPMSQIGIYMGWYAQDVCGPLAQPEVEFMPGAFGYHLHSYSACTVRSATQAWVGPMLAKGVTITMGTVAEPYLGGTPQVAVFISRLLAGFSFGEAAYAGQSVLSWQTTVIGDPLYRPFGRSAEDLHEDLARRHSPFLQWSFLRLANLHLAGGESASTVITKLENLDLAKKSAVLEEKLGDLYSADGKPSSAAHAWMEALKLDPSPQARVRITLELGEKLASLKREPEAYDFYLALANKCPGEAEKVEVLKKLEALARKMGKTNEAKNFESQINAVQ
ncbi:MAG TPA: TIGR03790 family protein [Verrucomicrobiae bacterium]|nr:TIGR03790 family protein [Verrucomicrobiae bacterium]